MSVSESSTEQEGLKLVADSWEWIKALREDRDTIASKTRMPTLNAGKIGQLIEHLTHVVHRHEFLELVVKGLTYMEQHDAQAYAKFVQKKRKLEDMDFEELRVLLR